MLFGPLPGEKGVWNGSAGSTLATNVGRGLDNNRINLPTNLKIPDVPFQDWARALYDSRQANNTADDPHVRCKPSGGPRLFHTPYGFEIVDVPELERIFIMGVGGPHTWRVIYMDGRKRPQDVDPTFQGYSIGHWEGEKLVVESTNFNERFWLSREGIPHTAALKLTETFERPEYDTLRYIATIDDPGAYTGRGRAAGPFRGIPTMRCTSTCARKTIATRSTCTAASSSVRTADFDYNLQVASLSGAARGFL